MSLLNEINQTTESEAWAERYQVQLPDFYGPMDLLLTLIEREELEITEISLAQVTDQYLAYVAALKEVSPDNLTDFLVVASKLIFIKSQVLLPKPPPGLIEEEENETDDLVQQLKDYKRFKQLAQELYTLGSNGRRSFVRLAPPPKVEAKLKPGEANVNDLLAAVRQALAVKSEQPDVGVVIPPQAVTIGQQINLIRQRLSERDHLRFVDLFSQSCSRVEVIVTLLAILELIKHRFVDVKQEGRFGEIILIKLDKDPLSKADWAELENITEIS